MFRWIYDLTNNSEGLLLLEDHLRTTHGEDEASGDGEEEDEAWEGWESSGEDHLDVSDSDDEDGKNGDKLRKEDGDVNRTSTLATTKLPGKAVKNGGGSAERLNE
ncbi:hypothetical protein F5888DRAFT_1632171 [Russula emetica]|nr:hypothetical protein F5888DRAFT_1632171 [Russula emetica]